MRLNDVRTRLSELSRVQKTGLGTIFIVPLIVGVVVARVDRAIEGATTPAVQASAKLEVLVMEVVGGIDPTAQAIDLTVRNTGDTVSVITGAALSIRDSGLLRICEGGGGTLESSKDYDAQLPADPAPGDIVEARLSQQIAADEADRFSVRLSVPDGAAQDGLRLYHLDVGLLHDAEEEPLAAGQVIVSVPYLPAAGWFAPDLAANDDEMGACFRANAETLERFLALEGARADALHGDLLLGEASSMRPDGSDPAAASESPVIAEPLSGLAGTVQLFTDLAEADGLVCGEFESGISCNSDTGETWLALITRNGEQVEALTASARASSPGAPELLVEAARIGIGSDEAAEWVRAASPGPEGAVERFNGLEIQVSETDGVWFLMVGEALG